MTTRNKGIPAKKAASKKPAKRKAAPKAKKVVVSKKKPVARKAKPKMSVTVVNKPAPPRRALVDTGARFTQYEAPKSWWRRALSWLLGR